MTRNLIWMERITERTVNKKMNKDKNLFHISTIILASVPTLWMTNIRTLTLLRLS